MHVIQELLGGEVLYMWGEVEYLHGEHLHGVSACMERFCVGVVNE